MTTNTSGFLLLGNNIAVDFINTLLFDKGKTIELLNNHADLNRWINATNLSTQNIEESLPLKELRGFRQSIHQLLTQTANNQPLSEEALKVLNQSLLLYSPLQQIHHIEGGLALQPACTELTLNTLMGLIAHETAALLTSTTVQKLKPCSNPKCVLLFLDTSRSGKRRWCSMDLCGNRAKAANHYSKSIE